MGCVSSKTTDDASAASGGGEPVKATPVKATEKTAAAEGASEEERLLWRVMRSEKIREHPKLTVSTDGIGMLHYELGVAHGRLLSPEPVKKFAQSLHERGETSQLAALQHLSALLAASPHNRHVCAGPGGLVGLLLGQLAHRLHPLRARHGLELLPRAALPRADRQSLPVCGLQQHGKS